MQNQLPKKNMISGNLEIENIEQLLAEADDLIQRINSDAIKEMQEEQRPFSTALISSTSLSRTIGTNSLETASNGWRPDQAGGFITLAVWLKIRTLPCW
jgi:hypothetical protein